MTKKIPSPKKRTRRRFSDEFKREAVALLGSSRGNVSKLSAELGIDQSLLSRWAKEFAKTDRSERRPTYEELESEVSRLRRENDFLKKASRYFASRPPPSTGL